MINPYESKLCYEHHLSKTEKKICNTFIKIYEHKDFDKITIKEICDGVPVARSTFYQYFNNTREVKDMIEDNFIYGLLKSSYDLKYFNYDSKTYEQYIYSTLAYFKENRYLFKVFLVTNHDLSFIQKYKISIKYHYYDLCHGDEAALEIVSGYLMAIFSYIISLEREVDPEEIDRYVHILHTLIESF